MEEDWIIEARNFLIENALNKIKKATTLEELKTYTLCSLLEYGLFYQIKSEEIKLKVAEICQQTPKVMIAKRRVLSFIETFLIKYVK